MRFGFVLAVAAGLIVLSACTHTVVGTGASSSGGTSGATTSTLVPVDTGRLCRLIVTECRTVPSLTILECVANFGALRTSTACANQIPTATCDTFPDIVQSCFPECSVATDNTCLPDGTITVCGVASSGQGPRLYTFSCDGVCRSQQSTYTGTCGYASPDGSQASEQPKCWCQ